MEDFQKVINPGRGPYGEVFCKIKYKTKKPGQQCLSISGVEGPKTNGDCRGSCGQIVGHLAEDVTKLAPGWDLKTLLLFQEHWKRWHLNDMRAGCEHQRTSWDLYKELELVDYKRSTKFHDYRISVKDLWNPPVEQYPDWEKTVERVNAVAIAIDRPKHESEEVKALLGEGWIEAGKTERKKANWVSVTEHPEGCLSKPCEVCGYRYGSAWLYEGVPENVLEFLAALPETTVRPAWV